MNKYNKDRLKEFASLIRYQKAQPYIFISIFFIIGAGSFSGIFNDEILGFSLLNNLILFLGIVLLMSIFLFSYLYKRNKNYIFLFNGIMVSYYSLCGFIMHWLLLHYTIKISVINSFYITLGLLILVFLITLFSINKILQKPIEKGKKEKKLKKSQIAGEISLGSLTLMFIGRNIAKKISNVTPEKTGNQIGIVIIIVFTMYGVFGVVLSFYKFYVAHFILGDEEVCE